jgi:hypothetical protein
LASIGRHLLFFLESTNRTGNNRPCDDLHALSFYTLYSIPGLIDRVLYDFQACQRSIIDHKTQKAGSELAGAPLTRVSSGGMQHRDAPKLPKRDKQAAFFNIGQI